jgi:hypothetical protein
MNQKIEKACKQFFKVEIFYQFFKNIFNFRFCFSNLTIYPRYGESETTKMCFTMLSTVFPWKRKIMYCTVYLNKQSGEIELEIRMHNINDIAGKIIRT